MLRISRLVVLNSQKKLDGWIFVEQYHSILSVLYAMFLSIQCPGLLPSRLSRLQHHRIGMNRIGLDRMQPKSTTTNSIIVFCVFVPEKRSNRKNHVDFAGFL